MSIFNAFIQQVIDTKPCFVTLCSQRPWVIIANLVDQLECFTAVRLTVLSKPRVLLELANKVVSMREKMRAHLAKGDAENIDLKQDAGGIADIEFIVQFMLLAHTNAFPSLAKWPDNVRILADLARLSLITKAEADILNEAYLEYRNYAHRLALQNAPLATINPSIADFQTKVEIFGQK